ncbi:hypothetical protein FVEG_13209 [Fusarium verticillioides 7600]|uniref:Uncharacterized protein n=1 Tax=Gibberella moniliformis (strain M3125 / FGSC 7600) TaxID=334819 RepID=W7NFW4_GIBM7|nr:hypothetical protein FVEG_13209 [Fusarium verticillioides 7600]EWG55167.1 hypothetical protein FVEG_13209 [Fusarium verticillioides 7600]
MANQTCPCTVCNTCTNVVIARGKLMNQPTLPTQEIQSQHILDVSLLPLGVNDNTRLPISLCHWHLADSTAGHMLASSAIQAYNVTRHIHHTDTAYYTTQALIIFRSSCLRTAQPPARLAALLHLENQQQLLTILIP